MANPQELADKLSAAMDAVRYRYRRRFLTGRRLNDDTVTLDGAAVGKVWVRGTDQSREQTQVWGYISSINVPVKVDRAEDGEYEIVGVIYQQGVPVFGDAIHAVTSSPAGDELTARSIAGIGFKPGRLELSVNGGLFIHVSAFDYDGGSWLGLSTDDFSLSPSVVTGIGNARWVKVGFDPTTSLLVAYPGTEALGDRTILTPGRAALILVPPHVYPLGAVALVYGQTVITNTDIDDARFHLGIAGTVTADPSSARAGDTVMWDGTGYVLTSGEVAAGFTQTANVTVANSTTETTLVGAGSGSLTLPSNTLEVGDEIELEAWGVLSSLAVLPGTLNVKIKWGSVAIAVTGTATLTTSLSNALWHLKMTLVVRSVGASGAIIAQGKFSITNVAADIIEPLSNGVSTVTVDTTIDEIANLTVTFSTASASNTITCTHLSQKITSAA